MSLTLRNTAVALENHCSVTPSTSYYGSGGAGHDDNDGGDCDGR